MQTEERLQPIVGRLEANDADLRVKRRGENPDIEVKFSTLTVSNIGKNRQMIIAGTAHNVLPSVDISLKGVFGPFRWSDMKRTPLSGMISLKRLNLNQMQSLGGTGSGYAIVAGPFNHLDMHGSLNSHDFHSLNSRIPTSMTLDLAATLDGATGNTWFHEARAHFLHSDIYAYGSLIYDDLGRRHTELFLKSRDTDCGEISNLLLASAPPLLGNLDFDAHSKVLSGHNSLIDRLNLTGNFRVTDARFRNEQIQTRIEKLSRRIQQSHLKGMPSLKDTSLTLVGNVVVEGGAAQFPSLQLRTPGLIAVGEGALSLAKPTIAMHGQMELDSSLSRAIGGFKGILALPLDPFFSKHGMTVVPFVLDGPVADPILKTLQPKRPKTSN